MSKEILITKGQKALVDDELFDELMKFHWHTSKGNGGFYAARRIGSRIAFMHKLVINMDIKGVEVDHINGNTLDNRRSNLRPATRQENARNGKKHGSGSSQYKGVTWDANRHKWRAQIRVVPGNTKYLGRYDDEKEAALAYNQAAQYYFREFARLNEV